ncbi:hypothetical protein Hanom_Chr05g00450981 [Helianthus anomalus]
MILTYPHATDLTILLRSSLKRTPPLFFNIHCSDEPLMIAQHFGAKMAHLRSS